MQKLTTRNRKLIVTKEMLSTFPMNARHDLRTAFFKWWINSRINGGLRLTSTGYKILVKMQYDTYHFTGNKITTSINLLVMDQHLACPYYIDGIGCVESKIVIFGGMEATIINLYGNFNNFLDSINEK